MTIIVFVSIVLTVCMHLQSTHTAQYQELGQELNDIKNQIQSQK